MANGAIRTACGLKMMNEAMKPSVDQIKEIIRLAKVYGYIKGDEKLTLPQILEISEKVLNVKEKENDEN